MIVDPATAEVSRAQILVAAFGASNYTCVEATVSQELAPWIGSHIRALEFFGGVPGAVVPDNLRDKAKVEEAVRNIASPRQARFTVVPVITTT